MIGANVLDGGNYLSVTYDIYRYAKVLFQGII